MRQGAGNNREMRLLHVSKSGKIDPQQKKNSNTAKWFRRKMIAAEFQIDLF